jgi:TonB family protein
LGLGLALSRASGQTVGGLLVDRPSNRPLQRARIVLLDSAARRRDSTLTDSLGRFMLDVPGPGPYRLAFHLDSLDLGMTNTIIVAGDDFVQRQFMVEVPRQAVYLAFQVSKQVAPRGGNRAPRYPDELRSRHIEGSVLAQFVVDTLGRPELATLKILRQTDLAFANAVRDAIPDMRFFPASIGDRPVRQLVQMPFEFSLTP